MALVVQRTHYAILGKQKGLSCSAEVKAVLCEGSWDAL